jgi:hypothetical protein
MNDTCAFGYCLFFFSYSMFSRHRPSNSRVISLCILSPVFVFHYTRPAHSLKLHTDLCTCPLADRTNIADCFFLLAWGIAVPKRNYSCIWRHQGVKQFLLARVTNWAMLTCIIVPKLASLFSFFVSLVLPSYRPSSFYSAFISFSLSFVFFL